MIVNKRDLEWQYFSASSKGGQHANKSDTNVRLTHKPTGIVITITGRYRAKNRKTALKELERRLIEQKESEKVAKKKEWRDKKIKDKGHIRTYHYGRNEVKDHRTGKTAPIKQVVDKGRLDLLS